MAQAAAEIAGQVVAKSEIEVGQLERSETVAAGQIAAGSGSGQERVGRLEIGSGAAEQGPGFGFGPERRRQGKAERFAAEVRRGEGQTAVLARYGGRDDRATVRDGTVRGQAEQRAAAGAVQGDRPIARYRRETLEGRQAGGGRRRRRCDPGKAPGARAPLATRARRSGWPSASQVPA